MVFSHRCIPLSVSLRVEDTSSIAKEETTESFTKLTVAISKALCSGDPKPLDEAWDYEYDNLWRHRWGKKPFHICSPKEQYGILMARTHWCKRLKPHNRNLLKRLLEDKKCLVLKEILHTCDGIVSALLVTFPEIFYSPARGSEYAIADQIVNNLISNGLSRYDALLADLKSMRKRFRKAAFECKEFHLTEHENRTYGSWMSKVLDIYNPMCTSTSRAKMFRVCVFTQSRATGLVGKKGVDATLEKFLQEVTTPRRFEPDSMMMYCIDAITDMVVGQANGGNPQFRISVSTSACTENPKREEGKFGHIRKCVNEFPPIGKFSPTNPGGQLGNWAFWKGMRLIEDQDPSIFKVNVAGIRENGKCRVVTSGSFYKDAVLQPFSHMTMQAIKNQRSLRNGLSAGRLGWRFISRIDHNDPVDGEPLFENVRRVLSVDWEKATDRPSHKSAHAISGLLLEKMRLPKRILDNVKTLWPGLKDLYVNGRYVGAMANGVPMGDPMTKTNLSLAHPICEHYARAHSPGVKVVHDGNGDDTAIILGARTESEIDVWVEAYHRGAAMLGYHLSENDTFVTSTWGTYCEEVFCIPVDRFNTVHTASKLKDNRYMPYLDHPKMRLVLDTQKDRRDYSSKNEGKVTLMGKDMWYANETVEGSLFSVASAIQDVSLGLRYEQRPMYLPPEVFSIGKVPHRWDIDGWTNAIWSQPPKVVNITVTAMRELNKEIPAFLTTRRAVKSAERHFEKELVVEHFTIPDDDPIKALILVPREKTHLFPLGVLDRLVESKHLTSSSEVEALYLFQRRLETLEQEVQADLFENLKTMVSPEVEYDKDRVRQTVTEFRSNFYKCRHQLRRPLEEDYYLTVDIDNLRNSDPRRVDIPEFDYINRFVPRLPADTPKRRAEERLFEWFNRSVDRILNGEDYDLPPVEILEDDPLIIQSIERSDKGHHIIVTNDLRLVRQAQNKLVGKDIGRISIINWLKIDADERQILDNLGDSAEDTLIHIDQGNLDAFLEGTGYTFSRRGPLRPPPVIEWTGDVEGRPVKSQEDVQADIYLPQLRLTPANVHSIIEGRMVVHRGLMRRGARRRGR
uniref:RNA-dependent RNA polymerase n=1 Tax=Plasmopara viticola lesion associated narnavirus 12 TaxID=2719495 RepID=A0A6G9RU67_9VIRU|nr:RNA-dependent RNA polymerase [Plasmopara viticola lesion associated narnavirus 12]